MDPISDPSSPSVPSTSVAPAAPIPAPTPKPVKHRQLPLLAAVLSLLVLSIIGTLAYQNFILRKQLSSIPPIPPISPSPIPSISLNPSPDVDLTGWKTITLPKISYLPFKSFKLRYPPTWSLTINGKTQEESPQNLDTLFLELKKGNSKIKITQAAFGGGGCLFPGDPDQEGPVGRYGKYAILRKTNGNEWRRSEYLNQLPEDEKNYKSYLMCYGIAGDGFSTSTEIGPIEYLIYQGENDLLREMDEIIKKIEIIN